MPSRHVLGMRVDLLSTKEAVSRITDAAESGQAGYCCVTNVHQCIMTYDDPAFRKVVNGAELVISDSTILRSSLGLCYGVKMPPPMRGAELMNALCAAAAEASVPVALIGGKTDEVLEPAEEDSAQPVSLAQYSFRLLAALQHALAGRGRSLDPRSASVRCTARAGRIGLPQTGAMDGGELRSWREALWSASERRSITTQAPLSHRRLGYTARDWNGCIALQASRAACGADICTPRQGLSPYYWEI